MCPYDDEIENIKNQIISKYIPKEIILFGSCAKGLVKRGSDIDICVIMETQDKRQTLRDMLVNIEYNVDLGIVIYTPSEWLRYKDDKANLANIIKRTGVSLIGGFG
ncbi:nucleotidyltransferase domain-containing protein [Desulfitobacterium chlororespirans]|uniref:Nucleotidyltransferase domain-containing protein n=1 Tax=Desulfitobacterium chlororespirans DSM 11544 TaxID=1121395 RepID=A0A1M7RV27_9FIRM|nr:nucleotidyltransferase domain-containing protein [Desulfitobacterium chlororespirans]SHN50135.1 Nucleotidyltransferase domain-containing protein [Desulfitobacterium chlororespirans DSM 11544]